MKKSTINLTLLICAALAVALSIWGPETLAAYKDRGVLNQIRVQEEETAGEGYRYQLNGNEKLYILSQCLNSQTLPESEQNALTRETENEYQDLTTGTYAFVVNRRGPTGQEITDEEIYTTCNEGLNTLKKLGI